MKIRIKGEFHSMGKKTAWEVESSIWIRPLKKKGVIKQLKERGLILVTYFDHKDVRRVKEFHVSLLESVKVRKFRGKTDTIVKRDQVNTEFEKVREFHKAFKYPMNDNPTPMSKEMILNRTGFIAEELIEALHATSFNENEFNALYTEFRLRLSQSFHKQVVKPYPRNYFDVLTGQIDSCTDISYFNKGDFTILGTCPDPIFNIVHEANMNKLHADGYPRYNEHGKIIKPEGWVAPEPLIEKEIQRQKKKK
ncbi:hypothetical protein EBB07_28145 [Paenibacillaceae bacterium]|nr:hypothetical protein EBB07_28145 [Paenibacillaceae bacterium]